MDLAELVKSNHPRFHAQIIQHFDDCIQHHGRTEEIILNLRGVIVLDQVMTMRALM